MNGKRYRNMVLSVIIATAMVLTIPPVIFAANEGSDGPDIVKAEIPDFELQTPSTPPSGGPSTPPLAPTGADILLYADFATGSWDGFTVNDVAGAGTYSHAGEWIDWIATTGIYNVENDFLNATVDASTIDGACAYLYVEFDYWGDGGSFILEVDETTVGTTVLGTFTGGVKTHTPYIPIPSGYAGTSFTLSFHVLGTQTRNFSIDNVTVFATYDTDLYIIDLYGLYIDPVTGASEMYDINQNGRYQKLPTHIVANVTNLGTEPIAHADFHLQIYKEMPLPLYDYKCWDMESCFLISWEAYDWDGDGSTWYYTEKRSHSPTHSFHTQEDYLDTYELDAHDSLILENWFHLPDTIEVGGLEYPVAGAYLSFWHWCEGEVTAGGDADYGIPVDYGQVFINDATGSHPVTGALYDTAGAWEWYDPYPTTDSRDTDGRDPIDISAWLGDDIKINFTWFSDDYLNFEGWYIDDVCIVLTLTSAQPLVFQGYQYADIPPDETVSVIFPIDYTFEDGYYYIQVYSDYVDCNLDNHELGHGYADEVNYTVWFGDVCDAAILDVQVDPEFETTYVCGAADPVTVPIKVTVLNNGTLGPEDIGAIPVRVQIFHKLTETLFEDDFEDADISDWDFAFSSFDGTGPYFPQHVTDYDANTGQYSLAYFTEGPNTDMYYLNNMGQGAFTPSFDVPPDYAIHTWFDFAAKWHTDNPYFLPSCYNPTGWPIYYTGYYFDWDAWAPGILDSMAGAFLFAYPSGALGYTMQGDHGNVFADKWNNPCYNPIHGGMNIFHIDMTDWIEHYQELGYLMMGMQVGWYMSTGPSVNYEMWPTTYTTWSGLMVDDVHVYYSYQGAKVWELTKTIELDPGESGVLWFNWSADEFCDYIIIATIQLDCDMDPTNNEETAETRIYTTIYEDDYEDVYCDDNTYGQPDHWHIVEECSVCPTNHFWWNGEESYNGYVSDTDDVLIINQTFNASGGAYMEIDFDHKFSIEAGWDWAQVEISNDSGNTWYYVAMDAIGQAGYWTDENPSWPDFDHVSLHIAPGAILWDDMIGGFIVTPSFFTDSMHVRFRFMSDPAYEWKGWFIDNVNISVDNATGMHWHVFYDDMENATWSEAHWIHMAMYYGCHWHKEDVFGNGPTATWFWNGENRTYMPNYGYYYYDVDEKLVLEYDLTHAYEAIMTFAYNYSFASGDYGYVEVSTDGGDTWTLLKIYGGTYGDGLNTSNAWTTRTIDMTEFAGGDVPLLLRFHFTDNSDGVMDYGWLVDNITITGKVDYLAPTVSAEIDPATPDGCNGWYVSDVTVTLTATDNTGIKAIYYSVDGGAYQTYNKPFKVTGDGEHTVSYYAEDVVGNISPTGTISFKIDKTAPTATITYPQEGYIYLFGRELFANPLGGTLIIGGITFQATASDATSGVDYVTFSIDGYTYEKATSPYEIWWHKFDLLPASYTLTVSAYDEACNKGADDTLSFTHWL